MNYLGFDTSNYTTSTALFDGVTFKEAKRILSVKKNERGLRQSDALFQHIKYFPEVFERLGTLPDISAVGVSTAPRNAEGSYMPVFLAGISFARSAAGACGVPLFEFSHQDGHIMAGIYSSGAINLLGEEFLSVHISGGTTEILLTRYNDYCFDVKIVGGTKDISAGQVIDRVGVKLGLAFPCGAALDVLSQSAEDTLRLPVSCDGGFFNFSGLETKANSISAPSEILSRGVFEAIADTLTESIGYCIKHSGVRSVLIVGGVASNTIIRTALKNLLCADTYFASTEMSTDNACGIAVLASLAKSGKRG